MNKLVTKDEIIKVYENFSKEEKEMMHADAVFEGSGVPGWAEDQYAGGGLCCPLQDVWGRFQNYDDFDIDEFIKIYNVIEEIYFDKITEFVSSMNHNTVQKYLKRTEGIINTINKCSLYRLLDDPKEYLDMYEKFMNTFKIAPLPYRGVELYWLNKIHDILCDKLYENWFDDFINSGYLHQTVFIKPVYKGLKSIGLDIDISELRDNWECYRKVLKKIIPKEKQKEFSKHCREEFKTYPGSNFYKI